MTITIKVREADTSDIPWVAEAQGSLFGIYNPKSWGADREKAIENLITKLILFKRFEQKTTPGFPAVYADDGTDTLKVVI